MQTLPSRIDNVKYRKDKLINDFINRLASRVAAIYRGKI